MDMAKTHTSKMSIKMYYYSYHYGQIFQTLSKNYKDSFSDLGKNLVIFGQTLASVATLLSPIKNIGRKVATKKLLWVSTALI